MEPVLIKCTDPRNSQPICINASLITHMYSMNTYRRIYVSGREKPIPVKETLEQITDLIDAT